MGVIKKGFQGPETYSSQLFAILKISRFFVLRLSYENSTSSLDTNIDLDDSDDSEFLGLGLGQQSLGRLTSMVNQFMIRGTHISIDWLLDLRAYGMNIARNTTSIDQMDWNEDRILYGNLEFSMSDFRGFIHGLITFTRTLLFEDLLFQNISTLSTQKIPEIPWFDIRDNSLDFSPFSNFLYNSRTDFGVDESTRWLWNRIINDSTLKNRFRKSNT